MDLFIKRASIVVAILGNCLVYLFPRISTTFVFWWNIIWYVALWPAPHGGNHGKQKY